MDQYKAQLIFGKHFMYQYLKIKATFKYQTDKVVKIEHLQLYKTTSVLWMLPCLRTA